MATDSTLTTLLENIEVNLRDGTRHGSSSTDGDLARLKNNNSYGARYIVPAFVPLLGHPLPYAVIAPGAAGKSGAGDRVDQQQVLLHVVHGEYHDPQDYYSTLGDGSMDGILTLAEEIENALTRSRPYNDGIHVAANGYSTQTNVCACVTIGWTAPERVEDIAEGPIFLVQTLTLEYRIEKGL